MRPVLSFNRLALAHDTPLVMVILAMSLVAPLLACSQAGIPGESITTALLPTTAPPTTSPANPPVIPTTFPTPQATPILSTTLIVWWPEPLASITRPELLADGSLLTQQINTFDLAEGGLVDVDFRLKAPQDVGGILSTLRTASVVAQGALPDVTLLRREDLLTAVQLGLLHPLEGMISPAVVADLYPIGLELGRVDGNLYGLAYTLDVLHLAYDEARLSPTPDTVNGWTFEALLGIEQSPSFVFPAARPNGVNSTFLIQYLAAGGPRPGADGRADEEALRAVLGFYEQGVAQSIIPRSVLEYQSSADYMSLIVDGSISAAIVTSNQYLQLRAEGMGLSAAPIPTADGDTTTIANSWMWVITAPTADRQALAARFINWMMDIDRQRQYLEAAYYLPSQEIALRGYDRAQVDPVLMDALFDHAVLPLPDTAGGTVARAMQSAVISVLNREQSAAAAVESVLTVAQQP